MKNTDAAKIRRLKVSAARLMKEYRNVLDTFDCGAKMAEYIDPNLAKVRVRINEILDELRVLDPENCPKERF